MKTSCKRSFDFKSSVKNNVKKINLKNEGKLIP